MTTRSKIIREWISRILLVEGRLDDVIKDYPEYESEIRLIASEDPSGNLKYLNWSAKQLVPLIKVLPRKNAARTVINVVKDFHAKLNKISDKRLRDINAWQDLDELDDFLQSISLKTRSDIKKEAKKLYEDERFLLVRPRTVEASCLYGANTAWCISADKDNPLYDYVNKGNAFYFLIDKHSRRKSDESKDHSPHGKFALQINKSLMQFEVYDSSDRVVTLNAIANAYSIEDTAKMLKLIAEDLNIEPLKLFGSEYLLFTMNIDDVIEDIKSGNADFFESALSVYPELANNPEVQNSLLANGTFRKLVTGGYDITRLTTEAKNELETNIKNTVNDIQSDSKNKQSQQQLTSLILPDLKALLKASDIETSFNYIEDFLVKMTFIYQNDVDLLLKIIYEKDPRFVFFDEFVMSMRNAKDIIQSSFAKLAFSKGNPRQISQIMTYGSEATQRGLVSYVVLYASQHANSIKKSSSDKDNITSIANLMKFSRHKSIRDFERPFRVFIKNRIET